MRYLEEVQKHIDFLKTYAVNDELETGHIIHMYPGKPAYPGGFVDARFFTAVLFNYTTKERRDLGRHDGIKIYGGNVDLVRIFADGSTLVRFRDLIQIANYNELSIYEAKGETK